MTRLPVPRYLARTRKITTEQEAAILTSAGTKRLRTVAAEFEVNHETIRAVARQERSAAE